MKIIACYKLVYEEQDIVVKNDGSLSFDKAEQKISLYDLNAVEAAVKIASEAEGSVAALSIGGSILGNGKLRKSILSRGPNELYLVKDENLTSPDTHQTAFILAEASKKIGFDIIICGEGSADNYAKQTGIQLGCILGLPCVDSVSKISIDNGKAIVERTLEDCIEVLEVNLPAVISVTSDINIPRVPTMKEILGASKKPVTEWTLSDMGISLPESGIEILKTAAPKVTERKNIIFEGDDKIDEFCNAIKGELI